MAQSLVPSLSGDKEMNINDRKGHLLRHRKNRGTSCLIVILALILVLLLGWYWYFSNHHAPAVQPPMPAPIADSSSAKIVKVEAPVKIDTLQRSPEESHANRLPRNISKGDYILITKSKHLLQHYRDGELLASYTVALGKNPVDKAKEGDNATPEGHYEVNYIKDASAWTHDFGDGKGEIKGAYGPYFIALYTGARGSFSGKTWRGIGIHGTHNPASIGTNASEGCIRLHNNELLKLHQEIKDKKNIPVDIIA